MSTYPATPGHKELGGTSELAARQTKERAFVLRELVYHELSVRNLTADEVAVAIGQDPLSVRPRLSELKLAGKIEKTACRRRNTSGKSAVVWRARSMQMELI